MAVGRGDAGGGEPRAASASTPLATGGNRVRCGSNGAGALSGRRPGGSPHGQAAPSPGGGQRAAAARPSFSPADAPFMVAGASRDPLAPLYRPQVEQFGLELRPRNGALVGRASNETADARVVVYRLGSAGLVTSHRIVVRRDLLFYEQSLPYLSVSTLSADSLALCPIAQPRQARAVGNVAVFGGGERAEMRRWLRAGSRQDATSVMLLPEWLGRLDPRRRDAARALMEEPGDACDEGFAVLIDRIMRGMSPLFGGRLMPADAVDRSVSRAVLAAIAWREERDRAERAAGTRAQAALARAAKQQVERRMAEPVTLDGLARDLLVSRARLCAAFKRETGESLGAYVRRAKMERARRLLEVRKLTVAQVARAVGYARVPSFTVAFEHETGLSPTAWRARQLG